MVKHAISFHYTLTDKDGKKIDASEAGHPLIFLTGVGQIIPGLESVIVAMEKGDKKTVTIQPKEAYGEFNSQLIYKVERSKLPQQDCKVGDMFEVGEGEDFHPVTVIKMEGDQITLDGNHPLAGQALTFAVEIADKRIATPEEVVHGHIHGTGGCNH